MNRVENPSGIKPLGRAVLLAPSEEELSSVIAIPDSVRERLMAVDFRATVIAVGPEAWKNESAPRAWPGDVVLVARYSGHVAKGPQDGKLYRLVNDNDVFAGLTENVS